MQSYVVWINGRVECSGADTLQQPTWTYSIIMTQLVPLKLNHECFMRAACVSSNGGIYRPTRIERLMHRRLLPWLPACVLLGNRNKALRRRRHVSHRLWLLNCRRRGVTSRARIWGWKSKAKDCDEKRHYTSQVVGNDYSLTSGNDEPHDWNKRRGVQRRQRHPEEEEKEE